MGFRGRAGGGTPPRRPRRLNGKVLTVDRGFRVVEAVAIRDGVFVLVGTNDGGPGARRQGHARDRRRRADRRPGPDRQPRPCARRRGGRGSRAPSATCATIAEIQAWVREKARPRAEGQWLFSPRVFPTRVRERRFPTRAELDAAAPRHPVVVDGAYALVLNTAALAGGGHRPGHPAPRRRGDRQGRARTADRPAAQRGRRCSRGSSPRTARTSPSTRWRRSIGATSRSASRASSSGEPTSGGYRAYEQLSAQGRPRVRATVTLRVSSDGSVRGHGGVHPLAAA